MAVEHPGYSGQRNAWLRRFPRPEGSPELRIFCFPPAGGGGGSFAKLYAAAGPQVECVAVELPGRMSRISDEQITDADELITRITEAVAAAVDETPYVLLGLCMGGILAYEVGERLERAEVRSPSHVVVGGSSAPQHGPPDVPDPIAFLRAMGSPDELFDSPELLEMTVGVLRGDLARMRGYRCAGRVLSAPLTVLYGRDDTLVDRAGLPDWAGLTSGDVTIEGMAGGHFFLNDHYEELLTRIRLVAGIAE